MPCQGYWHFRENNWEYKTYTKYGAGRPCAGGTDVNVSQCNKGCGSNQQFTNGIHFGNTIPNPPYGANYNINNLPNSVEKFNAAKTKNDYLDGSVIKFYRIINSNLKPYVIKLPSITNKGIISFSKTNFAQYQDINLNSNLITIIEGGIVYCTQLENTLFIYKKNIQAFQPGVNIFTSLATSYFINQNETNLKKINALWKKKIGFNTNDYNFYINDYYYNYYISGNSYALDCVKIISNLRFLWNVIYNFSIIYKINIDFWFYQTFYTCIFENLDGLKALNTNQINIYFNKYHENYLPESYNSIIYKWNDLFFKTEDVVNQLIYKQAPIILNTEELENVDIVKLTSILNYQNVKFNLLSCFSISNNN
jgi:hypothetical protein